MFLENLQVKPILQPGGAEEWSHRREQQGNRGPRGPRGPTGPSGPRGPRVGGPKSMLKPKRRPQELDLKHLKILKHSFNDSMTTQWLKKETLNIFEVPIAAKTRPDFPGETASTVLMGCGSPKMEMVDQVHGHKILITTILQRTVFHFPTFSEKKKSGVRFGIQMISWMWLHHQTLISIWILWDFYRISMGFRPFGAVAVQRSRHGSTDFHLGGWQQRAWRQDR
jgi:hypothetical protein